VLASCGAASPGPASAGLPELELEPELEVEPELELVVVAAVVVAAVVVAALVVAAVVVAALVVAALVVVAELVPPPTPVVVLLHAPATTPVSTTVENIAIKLFETIC